MFIEAMNDNTDHKKTKSWPVPDLTQKSMQESEMLQFE